MNLFYIQFSGPPWIPEEVRVDEAVTEPAYVEHALPGQGALLAPAGQTTQRADAMPSVFQTADQQRDPASRVSGEMSSGPGSRNESEAMPLSAALLREHTLGRVQAERMGGLDIWGSPDSPKPTHKAITFAFFDVTRSSARERAAVTRESSGGDPRLDQLTLLVESTMTRMERLEGSERSSRRSGASHSRSFGDHGMVRDSLGERYRETRTS